MSSPLGGLVAESGPWDDWGLIHAYHDPELHEFAFLVHNDERGDADGLVPLVHDTKKRRHNLIGGRYPDGRILWIQPSQFPAFFDAFPSALCSMT